MNGDSRSCRNQNSAIAVSWDVCEWERTRCTREGNRQTTAQWSRGPPLAGSTGVGTQLKIATYSPLAATGDPSARRHHTCRDMQLHRNNRSDSVDTGHQVSRTAPESAMEFCPYASPTVHIAAAGPLGGGANAVARCTTDRRLLDSLDQDAVPVDRRGHVDAKSPILATYSPRILVLHWLRLMQ